jgi:hypothetical protein
MSEQLGKLVVSLEANIAEFNRNMNEASQRTEQTSQRIMSSLKVVGGAVAALGAVQFAGALVAQANDVIDALASLDDMSQKTGSSVEILSRLGKVATMTGADFGTVDAALVKLSKNLASADDEGNKTAKALAAIGISTADLKNKDPGQVFVEVANKLQGYEDGANKVALVTDLMGKSAADLLPYMNDVSENLEKFTGDSTKAAGEATKLQDQLGLMTVKYGEIKTAIVTAALPAANDFIEAIKETTRQTNILTETPTITWADDVALVLARMADGGSLVGRTFRAVNAELTATAAHIEMMDAISKNVNPIGAAKVLATGGSPTDNIKAAMAKHDAQVALAYSQISSLWNDPMDKYEQAMQSRIAGRSDAAYMAGVDGLGGLAATPSTKELNYGGGDGKTTKTAKTAKTAKAAPEIVDPIPAIARMRESSPDQKMADRLVQGALNETLAIRGTIDATMDLQKAEQQRVDAFLRATDQNAASVERIRQDLMTDVEHEQLVYESRIEQLRIFGENKIGSEMAVNAWMEQETARHKGVIAAMDQQEADRKMQLQMQVMQQASGVADQMYSMLQKAGLEQSALGKAAFLASKGLAVAQIIMSTNAAAANALAPIAMGGLGPIAGMPLAATIKGLGYASAAMTAGLAIASAEGGYDIPGGVNPVTQLHEKEMVLPKAQAEVIRSLARNGGGAGGITINSSPQISIDSRTDQQEVHRIVADGVARGNADLVDRLQRAGRI